MCSRLSQPILRHIRARSMYIKQIAVSTRSRNYFIRKETTLYIHKSGLPALGPADPIEDHAENEEQCFASFQPFQEQCLPSLRLWEGSPRVVRHPPLELAGFTSWVGSKESPHPKEFKNHS